MMEDYGEIATIRFLDKMSKQFKNEKDLEYFGKLFGEVKIEEALQFAESKSINVTDIFEEVSKSVVMDIFE